ncbi:hypothetical protein [Mycoplasma sp. E35C]|uniref:hypothetical protein n=1 Tax=Mycoplasma sp. E35C TaxID=2801918 RepID=UPI00210740DD|nr:hypothetical protein [Mycoplasma sp. E35C]
MSQELTNTRSITYTNYGSIRITDKAFLKYVKAKINQYLDNNKYIQLVNVDLYHFYDDVNAQINVYVKYLNKKRYDNNFIKNISNAILNDINVELSLSLTSINFIQRF